MRRFAALPCFSVVFTLAMVGGACTPTVAPIEAQTPQMREVAVEVTYRERMLLTPGHVLTVRLEDVSLADAPARVMDESRETVGGRGPPYRATLSVAASAVDPRHDYAVRAEIRDADGRLRFTTDTRHAVLTHGAGDTASITLVMVP